jgi:hypothetical protein
MLIFDSGHRPIYDRQMLYFFDPILKPRAEIPPPREFYCIRKGAPIPQGPFVPNARHQSQPPSGSETVTVRNKPDADAPVEHHYPATQDLQQARGFVRRLQIDAER